jgi:hypothetical protein
MTFVPMQIIVPADYAICGTITSNSLGKYDLHRFTILSAAKISPPDEFKIK